MNLTSVFLGCKSAVPVMKAAGGGSIVNVSSASGLRYTGAAQVGYASAKSAIIQLSRVTAVQYAPDGIRVNTVVPGQLHTPMVEARLAGQRAGGDLQQLLEQRQARIPLGFMGDGRDTAYAALFLASDESRFVTGTEIVVDGGMTVRCDGTSPVQRDELFEPSAGNPGAHPDPTRPSLRLPAGSTDAHCHVFGPGRRFPYADDRTFTPVDAPREEVSARQAS